ncbi:RNA polymerase, sigma-24 subunit, RpoE [Proteiniborus ethanoligenes]|uniref:RNA polymerase, sigma-24 subunit, RpoE n=1 Tax=Proteiniborus ethanoligenes TaxID=415015 RepID=A0A1H3S441_9FIRM|nr:sigma-70 family RNA polymerase sigma factor [Proteiniborus ethanoligenes]TAH61028.1 MAG: sigma-70 family RNA polymerase sigma factor [Gottschalkiaceae bacterium]SDZ32345.1 RNA polymerase, sigma-24 subunit, RpoE [Proteiniborus ethanoligenes]
MVDREQKLIKKCMKGNLEAFDELIGKYEKTAYNIALKMLKNPEDAMDVSQEAFIKVFRSIKTFNFGSSFSTWLYRIVTNTCLDFLRKKTTNVYSIDNPIQTDDGEIERDIPDDSHTPEELLERKLTKELVNNSIDKLDDNHRTVIILRDIQGFSYEEISTILDCSIGTVKSRISRARNNLKEIIIRDTEQMKETVV